MRKRKPKSSSATPHFKPEVSLRENPTAYDKPYQWDFSDLEEFTFPRELITGDLRYAQELGNGAREIMDDYNVPLHDRAAKEKATGMEVGDDRVDISKSPTTLALGLCVQSRVVGMKTSAKDTFISPLYWNFCEVTNTIPVIKEGSFHHCRKVGSFENLEYSDTVILRIIIDANKSDRSHSSTAVGKASMLASRLNTPRNEHRQDLFLASYVQDGCLRTSHSADPKYLPTIMGGSGSRAPFNDARNLHLSVLAYKGGGYDRLYGTATEEVRQCIRTTETDNIGTSPVLCTRLRDRQDYLHGTYAEKVFIPKLSAIAEFGERLPPPLYEATGGQNRFSAVENRLVRTRLLLGRRDAERELESTFKLRSVLFSNGELVPQVALRRKIQSRDARKRFGFALQANTAFKALLDRKASIHQSLQLIANDDFITINCGTTQFKLTHAEWLFAGGKGEVFSINDLTTSEDMFFRKEVSTEETLRVSGIPLRPIAGRKAQRLQTTTNRIGLYQVNGQMQEWSENIGASLESLRDTYGVLKPHHISNLFTENPEWVDDDKLIIEKCYRDVMFMSGHGHTVLLVSQDRRLATQQATTCNVTVIRVDTAEFAAMFAEFLQDFDVTVDIPVTSIWERLDLSIKNQFAQPQFLYIDTGSLAAVCAKLDFHRPITPPEQQVLVRKEVVSYQITESGKRTSNVRVTKVNVPARLRSEVHRPLTRSRKYRTYQSDTIRRSSSNASGAGAWRSLGSE